MVSQALKSMEEWVGLNWTIALGLRVFPALEFPGDPQKPLGHGPGQATLGVLAGAGVGAGGLQKSLPTSAFL